MIVLPSVLALALAISPAGSRSARQKFERIDQGKVPPGATVILTEDEINSYLRYDFADEIPPGLSDPHIQLEPDRVIGDVMVDFVEWQTSKGAPPNFLLSWLLRGKKRVDIVSRYTSADGEGQVDIESVKIGGVPISPAAVSYLIENVVRPRYPAAVVGRPVPLGYNLKQVKIEQDRAVIVMAGKAR